MFQFHRLVLCSVLGATCVLIPSDERKTDASWQEIVARRLPEFGHRNWIVIADSAYPSQSKPGIETIVTQAEQFEVIREVLRLLDQQKHVRANVYLDEELTHLVDRDARGISRYRNQLRSQLGRRPTTAMLHNDLILKLDNAAAKFNVLILKTKATLPYTSVFLELDCGYWSAEAEQRLREAMKKPVERPEN